MRAIVHSAPGGSDVLRLVERPVPEPGPGEVRVRVQVSGVNPTDWKARRRGLGDGRLAYPEIVPNQDGAGVIDAVGPGVEKRRVGERVWLWEAARERADGTAQELVVLPEHQAVPLPAEASFDVGASLGIPALTAHRCLSLWGNGPSELSPGALAGATVLVAGGAGAVGHAAIQLAKWAGARVIATVSSSAKEGLALAAGADHVVDYRAESAADEVRTLASEGVNVVVEVAPTANAALDAAVVAPRAAVAVYAVEDRELALPAWPLMVRNVRYEFVLIYTVPAAAKERAVAEVSAAAADGALPVGEESGLPLHRFPLERAADAHDAVEGGAVGKVLIDLA